MASPLEAYDLNDINEHIADAGNWDLEIWAVDGLVSMGVVAINSNLFSDGTSYGGDRQLKIRFVADVDDPVLADGDYVEVDFDNAGGTGQTLNVLIPGSVVKDTWYYINTAGVLFEDELLTIPVSGGRVNETLVIGESRFSEDYLEFSESVLLQETDRHDHYKELLESVRLIESVEQQGKYFETVDAVTLEESQETEGESAISESLVLSETYSLNPNVVLFEEGLELAEGHFIDQSVDPVMLITVDITSIFQHKGFMFIAGFEFHGEGSANMYFAVDYKFKKSDDWTRTSFVLTNDEGFARINVAGRSIRLVFKADDFENCKPARFRVAFHEVDKRYKRGQIQ